MNAGLIRAVLAVCRSLSLRERAVPARLLRRPRTLGDRCLKEQFSKRNRTLKLPGAVRVRVASATNGAALLIAVVPSQSG